MRDNGGHLPRELSGITHGRVVQYSGAPGFWLTDISYPPGAHYRNHSHEHSYLAFVLRGGFSERAGTVMVEVEAGTVVFMPKGRMHENRIGPEATRSLVIALNPGFERLMPGWKTARQEPHWITRGIPLDLPLRIYNSFRLAPTLEVGFIEESLFTVFRFLGRRCNDNAVPGKKSLDRVVEFLHEQYSTSFRLDQLAILLNWNPAYLCRAFRRRFGCTIGEYVRDLRIRKAMGLITSTDIPLSEIAVTCGFADQSHMTRVFRASIGLPPSAYRRFVRVDLTPNPARSQFRSRQAP